MAGIKLRMPGGDAWQFLGTALGANPTPMAYAEVYTGLQTGAIDGQDNPLPNVENMKFYEVMSQIVLTSHLVGFDLLTRLQEGLGRDGRRQAGEIPRRPPTAAIDFSDRKAPRPREGTGRDLQGARASKIYEPDVAAFRKHVAGTVPRPPTSPRTGRPEWSTRSTRSSPIGRLARPGRAGAAAGRPIACLPRTTP